MSPHGRQRGAALLLAMLVVTVVSTLAAGMVWLQWRSVQAEEADRARGQGLWILQGALDWARLILREDLRGSSIDHLGEPWAVPLQEARLSTFLAGGRDVPPDNPALSAFLSGQITDAQSRFNLRNLAVDGPQGAAARRALPRLCEAAGVSSEVASLLLDGAQRTWGSSRQEARSGGQAALLAPQRLRDLGWWGVDAASIRRLEPWVVVLPRPTPLNLNTASAEVIAASVEGTDLPQAQRLVALRDRSPLRSLEQGLSLLQLSGEAAAAAAVSVQSSFFLVQGRLRLGERLLEDRALVERGAAEIAVRQRERGVSSPNPVSLTNR